MGYEDMDDTKFMALEWHCLNNIQVPCRFQDIDSWWPSIILDGTECGGKWVVTIVEHVESRFAELMRTLLPFAMKMAVVTFRDTFAIFRAQSSK